MTKIIKHCFLILAFERLIVLTLTKNMRLETVGSSANSNLKDFVNWIIKIGDETFEFDNDGEADVGIPSVFILESRSALMSIIEFMYPNLLDNMQNFKFLKIEFY